MNHRLMTVWTLVLSTPLSTLARSPAEDKSLVALFPFTVQGRPDDATIKAAFDYLTNAAAVAPGIGIVSGADLQKRLRGNPAEKLAACKDKPKCIGALGAQARAEHAIVGLATAPDKGGARLALRTIDTQDGTVSREISLDFANLDGVKPALEKQIFPLLGITETGDLLVTDAERAVLIDDAYAGTGPGPYELTPGRHEVKADGYTQSVMILPGKTLSIIAAKGKLIGAPEPASPPTPAASPAANPAPTSAAPATAPPAGTPGKSPTTAPAQPPAAVPGQPPVI